MEVKYPPTTLGQVNLTKDIKLKISTDGPTGELHDFIIAKEINLANNVINGDLAIIQDHLQQTKSLLSQRLIAQRNTKMTRIRTLSRGIAADLKVLYRPEFEEMTAWGFTIINTSEVDFPITFEDWGILVGNIAEMYDTFEPGGAPIEGYLIKQEITMPEILELYHQALINDTEAKDAILASQIATETRDSLKEVMNIDNHFIIEKLLVIHKGQERNLGDYKIVTTNMPQTPKLQTSSIIRGGKKTLQGIKIPGTLTSNVNWDMIVHDGKLITGKSRTLKAKGTLPMIQFNSEITIENPNMDDDGEVTVEVWK
ncbi:MAG: hypothetical protein WCL14_01625 [Bacteroidota bacterium]